MDWCCPQAATQELMLYWLQQLQVQRWRHRWTTINPRSPKHHPVGENRTGSTGLL